LTFDLNHINPDQCWRILGDQGSFVTHGMKSMNPHNCGFFFGVFSIFLGEQKPRPASSD